MKRTTVFAVSVVFAFAAYAVGAQRSATVKPDALLSQVGRYQVVQLHQSTDASWSGLVDTQTGCVWAYAADSNKNMVWDLVPGGPCLTH